MRITNQLISHSSVSRLQKNLQALERAQAEVSSGLRVRRMSDDPVAASDVVRISGSMRALEQFKRNIRIGNAKASAEENALDQLTNTLGRGVELAVAEASSTGSAQTRLIAKAEVDQLLGYAVSLGNTRFGEDYLFGGTRGNEAPLRLPAVVTDPFTNLVDAANLPVNPSGGIPIEIGDGHFVNPNHNATEVFLNTGALQSLRDLSVALGNNNVAGLNAAMSALQNANNDVQTLIGTQGARANEITVSSLQLESQEASLTTFRSDLRDAEVEKAMIELVGRQTGYQAAMAATSRVLGLSLANYL
jgi:flagellar hook-associated protein 3 FlgL